MMDNNEYNDTSRFYYRGLSDEQQARIQEINENIKTRGYILMSEAHWLEKMSRTHQVCADCGRTRSEARLWRIAVAQGKRRELPIGCVPRCYQCELTTLFDSARIKETAETIIQQ